MLKFKVLLVVGLFGTIVFACTSNEKSHLDETLRRYIAAANQHDIATLGAMIAEDAVWYLGQDTLVGRTEVLRPLEFDAGANTILNISNVNIRVDTVDFDLVERNDILTALGVSELHHFPRFIFREGLIYRKQARRPPLELEAFADSIRAFARWVGENNANDYDRLWPNGRFAYGRDVAETMLRLIDERKRKFR